MGQRGPAPKPSALKVLQGTFRDDRAKGEVHPEGGICSCPSWLSREAKAEWKYIVPKLEKLGLLTYIDKAALVSYVTAYADLQITEKVVSKQGYSIILPNGCEQPRPEVAVRNKARETIKKFLAEFGLSPASRTRINATPPKEKETKTTATSFLSGK